MNACCCHPDLLEVVLRTVALLAGCLCRREEAALRLVLERREAELREAMKLRHSLTTLLHALRANMERVSQTEAFFVVVVGVSAPIYQLPSHLKTLSGGAEAGAEGKRLARAEADLGDHLTGGVVQRWRQVQRRLLSEGKHPNAPFGVRWRWRTDLVTSGDLAGQTGVDTDQDKLLARLESDLKESQQLVRLQQQLLQVPQRSTPPKVALPDVAPAPVVGSRRTAWLPPPPPSWPTATSWKSGNVCSCTGRSCVARGRPSKESGAPSPTPPSD